VVVPILHHFSPRSKKGVSRLQKSAEVTEVRVVVEEEEEDKPAK
jgi:archaeosine-15-forming tRNA-guanine transglycosylase